MAELNLMARIRKIRVLSKYKSTLKSQIIKEENITKSMMGLSLSTYKVRDKIRMND
jgi:hypothetical protein